MSNNPEYEDLGIVDEHEVILGLRAEDFSQAMKEFTEHTTPKGLALWLQHPNRLLGNRTPLETLERDSQGYEKVAAAARMWADPEGNVPGQDLLTIPDDRNRS
jgi:hypothetical protein